MKKFKVLTIKALIITVFFFSLAVFQVSAELDPAVQEKCAKALVKLDLLRGDQNGNLKLKDKITRCEFITLVIRMLGLENDTGIQDIELKFKDISEKHWAYNNIKIAYKHKLITGYDDNTIRPNNYVTFTEARAVLIRALGYENTMEGKWPDNVINKSAELGLNKNLNLPKDKEMTRGETAVLIFNSLMVEFNR